jgi:DNA-binding MarR family transcriptional regulator
VTTSKPTSLTGTGLCVCFQLRKASRAVTQLYDAAFQACGIRSTQFALLVAIAKKEPITVTNLGELMVIDPTTLSRSLGKLEHAGHVKVASGRDRRQRWVRLSAKGRRVMEKSVPHWRKVQAAVVSRLSHPDWSQIQKSIQNIKEVAQKVSGQAPAVVVGHNKRRTTAKGASGRLRT